MKTIEALLVVLILFGAFFITSQLAVLPSPRLISTPNLRELAKTILQTLDAKGELSEIVFKDVSDPSWDTLQSALSLSLPPNIAYNLTVYDILTLPNGTVTYRLAHSISSNEEYSAVDSETASYFVASSNVTFTITPQKIMKTLYILNCSDANGWWITGYTAQSLAADVKRILYSYFQTTILVNSTQQLGQILNGNPLKGENVQSAIVVNTFGEVAPIPSSGYSNDATYCRTLGQKVRIYNWTWVSIVGYPFFYITNTETLKTVQNGYGIYGIKSLGATGLNAFLAGLDNQGSYGSSWITDEIGLVQFTSEAYDRSNYYGIYPAPNQMASRALSQSIESSYHLTRQSPVFNIKSGYIAAATFRHNGGGALTAIGLTRIPDIRVASLAVLMYYHPTLYKSEFTASGTSRLVTLQLGQHGGT